jgi:hypothetical protein
MTLEEINTMKYRVCCLTCDNKKCVRGTDSCEAEQWAKSKALGQEPWEDSRDRLLKAFDDVKSEIEKLQTYKMFVGEKTVYIERDDVLAIIDKCRAEIEAQRAR